MAWDIWEFAPPEEDESDPATPASRPPVAKPTPPVVGDGPSSLERDEEIRALRIELGRSHATLVRTQPALEEAHERIAKLRAAMEGSAAERRQLVEELREALEEVAARDAEIAELRDLIADASAATEPHEEAKEEGSSLGDELHQMRAEIERLAGDVRSSRRAIDELRSEAQRTRSEALRRQLGKARASDQAGRRQDPLAPSMPRSAAPDGEESP